MQKHELNLIRASYGYLIQVMDKHVDLGQKKISPKRARWVLSRFMIPKELRHIVIKEMMDKELLIWLNKRTLEIRI